MENIKTVWRGGLIDGHSMDVPADQWRDVKKVALVNSDENVCGGYLRGPSDNPDEIVFNAKENLVIEPNEVVRAIRYCPE